MKKLPNALKGSRESERRSHWTLKMISPHLTSPCFLPPPPYLRRLPTQISKGRYMHTHRDHWGSESCHRCRSVPSVSATVSTPTVKTQAQKNSFHDLHGKWLRVLKSTLFSTRKEFFRTPTPTTYTPTWSQLHPHCTVPGGIFSGQHEKPFVVGEHLFNVLQREIKRRREEKRTEGE
jgi:hypothetical protein